MYIFPHSTKKRVDWAATTPLLLKPRKSHHVCVASRHLRWTLLGVIKNACSNYSTLAGMMGGGFNKKISNVTVLNCMGTKCKSPVNAAAKSYREKSIKVPVPESHTEPASSTLMREDEDPARCTNVWPPLALVSKREPLSPYSSLSYLFLRFHSHRNPHPP